MNVYPQKMIKNLNITNGMIFSQRVMLELTKYGFSREQAYKIVQRHSLNSWNKNLNLYDSLKKDSNVTNKISVNKLKKLFNSSYHNKKISIIFKRIFK